MSAPTEASSVTVERLGELLSQADLSHVPLSDGSGFKLGIRSKKLDIEPVLVGGESTVWLLTAVPTPSASRAELLESINSINAGLPFGVFYLTANNKVTFRNAIRLQTLRDAQELMVFVLVSTGLLEEVSEKLQIAA